MDKNPNPMALVRSLYGPKPIDVYNEQKREYWRVIKEKIPEKVMNENKDIIGYYFDMSSNPVDAIFVLSNKNVLKEMKEKLKKKGITNQ